MNATVCMSQRAEDTIPPINHLSLQLEVHLINPPDVFVSAFRDEKTHRPGQFPALFDVTY